MPKLLLFKPHFFPTLAEKGMGQGWQCKQRGWGLALAAPPEALASDP